MAVKISRLWSNKKFQNLSDKAKILYLYLSTNPNLTIVGVFSPNLDVVVIETGTDILSLRSSTTELIKGGFIHVKKINDVVYFIVPEHFNSIPKAESSVAKVQKELQDLPEDLVSYLETISIGVQSKVKNFEVPTAAEVVEYGLSLGYIVDGKTFVEYYESQSERYGKKGVWVDGRGTQVRDWKAKLRRVWCKEESKLKTFKDAPKGFENFYIVVDGVLVFPDGWKNGKPYSKSFIVGMELEKEYENRRRKESS